MGDSSKYGSVYSKMSDNPSHSYKIEPPSSKAYRKELVDPKFWHPEAPNFHIIDWEKFYAQNPIVPKVYTPTQRKTYYNGVAFALNWWSNRSWLCQPIGFCYRPCSPKNEMESISDLESGKLFTGLLGPNPNPENIPEPLRNKLIWTRENVAPETLISFNRFAWRPNTPEGRVIGLGDLHGDWTNNASTFGTIFGAALKSKFCAVQVSPDGKWIVLSPFSDPDKEVNNIFMYVVQDDDVFTDTNGKVLEFVKPGDLMRLSWNLLDVYDVGGKTKYEYFPRVVATLNEEKGTVDLVEENFSELLEKATSKPECGTCLTTCGYTCTCCWSGEDRVEFQYSYVSDRQIFTPTATPPESSVIDRL